MNEENQKLILGIFQDIAEKSRAKEGEIEKMLKGFESMSQIPEKDYIEGMNLIGEYKGAKFENYTTEFLKYMGKVE